MRFATTLIVALFLWATANPVKAAHTQARLLAAQETARPGETVLVGLQLRMDPGWHTYWRNPGDSGIATEIHWRLPAGVSTNELEWPVPEKLAEKELTTYIYTGEVVLLMPLKLASNLAPGPLTLKADVSWLECKIECVPGKAEVATTITIGDADKPSQEAPLLANWQKRLPKPGQELNARAWWDTAAASESRRLLLEWKTKTAVSQPDFYPYPSSQYEVQAATETVPSGAGSVRLRKEVRKLEGGGWPSTVPGVIVQNASAERTAYQVSVPLTKPEAATGAMVGPSVWSLLFYGFLGGLILNVMPCVLPVIALKILSFVGQAKEEPRRVRKLGLIYTAGVLVSFLVLAGIVIALKAAGRQAGWGMQFSNPQFIVVMVVLVTLVALNLFGVFEINAGSRVMGAAGSLAAKKGAAGAFFNGVLATILATPCTAAGLSYAVGFAFTRSALVILSTMLAVGCGMAAPYLVLSWQPAWLKFVPKPGPWMERFKVAMGFPMLATAVWLASLLPDFYGARAWWIGVFLVFLALGAWIFGEFEQRGSAKRGVGAAIAAATVIAGYSLVLEVKLHWRAGFVQTTSRATQHEPQGITWQPWSASAVAAARSEGRPILVDFTANWCLTCNTIVKPALEHSAVREKIEQTKTIAFLGDYTHSPPEMTSELSRFGRAGVPLVVVYPKNPDAPAMVLPDPPPLGLPSHYSRVIVDALTRAAE